MPKERKVSSYSPFASYRPSLTYKSIPGPTIPTQPTLGQSIKEGFGWGIGTSIARRLFGPCNPGSEAARPSETVRVVHTNEAYTKCLEEKGNKEECQQFKA